MPGVRQSYRRDDGAIVLADGGYPTNDEGTPICARERDTDGEPCERTVSEPGEACYMHGDQDLPEEKRPGAPEGNDNAVGNEGGPGAPEGNFFALKTGEHTSAKRRLEFLVEQGEEELAQSFADAYISAIDRGADPQGAVKIATSEAFAEKLERDLIAEGFERDLYHEGEHVGRVFDSDRASAVTSFYRESRLMSREEAITNYSRDDGAGASAHGNKDQLIDSDAWGDA